MRGVLLFGLCLCLYGCPPAMTRVPLDGEYEVFYMKPGETTRTSASQPGMPDGATIKLRIKGKEFVLGDMMVGFEGTVEVVSGTRVKMTTLENPSGKMEKPKTDFYTRSSDGKTLTMEGEASTLRIVFVRKDTGTN